MATEDPSSRLALTEYPLALWLFGGAAELFGIILIVQGKALVPGLIALGLGVLLVLVLAQVTTVSADRAAGRLSIRYWSPFRRTTKEFALWEIVSAEIERSGGRSFSPMYRVVLALKTGEQVPLHGYYSSGRGAKERIIASTYFLYFCSPFSHPIHSTVRITDCLLQFAPAPGMAGGAAGVNSPSPVSSGRKKRLIE